MLLSGALSTQSADATRVRRTTPQPPWHPGMRWPTFSLREALSALKIWGSSGAISAYLILQL
ncbi:hypothetical protein LX36DRAFT_654565 [Colletotrichum falcatum]|nr:hypothetical protein LX36DRAFT_654565 [Colletotrichum falcatum]